jgi:hypothetical protein
MKSVVIPHPERDCDEIAALKKMREALDKAIEGLEARKKTPGEEPSTAK